MKEILFGSILLALLSTAAYAAEPKSSRDCGMEANEAALRFAQANTNGGAPIDLRFTEGPAEFVKSQGTAQSVFETEFQTDERYPMHIRYLIVMGGDCRVLKIKELEVYD
ncbi:MAG: hypothetical protein ACXVBW_00870 [Bdellovibrionota bacterium]